MKKYRYTLLAGLLLTANMGFSKIEVFSKCAYESKPVQGCKPQNQSDVILIAAYLAAGSYKLEEKQEAVFAPEDLGSSWQEIISYRPKLEKLKQNFSQLMQDMDGDGSSDDISSSSIDEAPDSQANLEADEDEYEVINKAQLAQNMVETSKYGFDQISHFGVTSVSAGVIARKANQVFIAFHGTQNSEDVYADLKFPRRSLEILGMQAGSAAHQGVIDRYFREKSSMVRYLFDMIETAKNSNQKIEKIMVTGHSLGGALATLAAFDIKRNILPDTAVELISFNSPRVYNYSAAAEHEALLGESSYRLWRHYDPVSAIPQGKLGYKHVGFSLRLPYVSYWNPAENHKMSYTLNEVKGSAVIYPQQRHVGWL